MDFNMYYRIHGGCGTNMKVEAMAIWGLLWFMAFLDIHNINIYGDSQGIINHVLGSSTISHPHPPPSTGLAKEHHISLGTLQGVTLQHIHRVHNTFADVFSKQGLLDTLDGIYITLEVDGCSIDVGFMPFPWVFAYTIFCIVVVSTSYRCSLSNSHFWVYSVLH